MSSFQPGQMIGHYKVVSLLGKGGMATIYKGYQAEMDRFVAIKVLEHQFATDVEFLGRFRLEARLIARLEHPHILPVYDFGESDGLPYLVMRYLEAGTLSDRLRAGTLSLPEVDKIFVQFAEALGYAHEMGVIHRDVKPSNALLDPHGNLFLTDFGIAKLVEGSPNLTAAGAITGTPAYMSPEQAMGDKIGIQSDIFSLGVVLYEMLTGAVPFTAETPLGVLLKMVNEPLPAPHTIKEDLHPALEKVVMKALAKDLSERFANMQQFIRAWRSAIREVASGKKTAANVPTAQAAKQAVQKTSAAGKTTVTRKRHTWLWILTTIILLGAASAGIYFSGLLNHILVPVKASTPPAQSTAPVSQATELISTSHSGTSEPEVIKSTLANTSFDRIVKTPDGKLWFVNSNSPTVDEYDPVSQTWSQVTPIQSCCLIPLGFSPEGILLGGGTTGAWFKTEKTTINLTIKENLISNNVSAIVMTGEQKALIGTDSGLMNIDGDEVIGTLTPTQRGMPSNEVTAIYVAPDDSIWIGLRGGMLHILTNNTVEIIDIFAVPPDAVTDFAMDLAGRLWVTTIGDGIFSYQDKNWQPETPSGVDSRDFRCVTVSPDGSIWFGTEDSGVVVLNGDQWITGSALGLTQLSVRDILVAGSDIWLAGVDGLSRYTP